MNRKTPNAECVDCGRAFRRPPSLKVIRCDKCREGKQGKSYRKEGYEDARKIVQQSEAVSESEGNGVIENGQADQGAGVGQ
jgi:ribosomal protein L37AE/L43A